jgi:deoxyribose-phosphate aldolase
MILWTLHQVHVIAAESFSRDVISFGKVSMKYSYDELAKMIDHSLLHPTMTDQQLEDGCKIAARYGVASVCVKPYAVRKAAQLLKNTGVKVGTVAGFPHGSSTTEVKRYETEIACRDGAEEIDMVINIAKALSGDWEYVEHDITVVCQEAHQHNAKVKVIFENDFLPDETVKIRLCEICDAVGADWVKTSTGYCFVKGEDGKFSYKGATESDLKLMRAHVSERVGVKAAGGVRDLDALIRVRDLGARRCGVVGIARMLDEYRERKQQEMNNLNEAVDS